MFVKIHAPIDVLKQYAELMKMRLPMKEVKKLRFFPSNYAIVHIQSCNVLMSFMKNNEI